MPDSERTPTTQGGRQSQISGYYDPIPTPDSQSGWVYIVANNFDRTGPVVLYRATPEKFTDRASWQGWSRCPEAGWDKPPTPLWADRIGEMCIRQIDGKTVLVYFNATTGNMEVRVADDPTPGHRAGDDGRGRGAVARSGRTSGSAGGQPAGAAVRRLHLAGFDARRVAGLRQPVEHRAARRQCAVPGDPVRGEPVQALVDRLNWAFRPQCVRSSTKDCSSSLAALFRVRLFAFGHKCPYVSRVTLVSWCRVPVGLSRRRSPR